jgi:hypothetical protein
MAAAGAGTLLFDDEPLADRVDKLAKALNAGSEDPEPVADGPSTQTTVDTQRDLASAETIRLVGRAVGHDRERHTLVFVQRTHRTEPDEFLDPAGLDEVARGLVYGVHWPHRREFTTVYTPEELAGPGRLAAVSHYASVLFGQADEVHSSVLLSTVQTVGTAARFQWIWRQAYRQVREFQVSKQAHQNGQQTRESLAPLADEMGNLELDLTFNVQTAADLGLGSTIALVDPFHTALHEAMKFKTRAETVANMFQRVNSSIQSELTAIVSREKEVEDLRRFAEQQHAEDQRFRGALVLGLVTFGLAPLGLILGYFGINTKEVTDQDSILYFHHYWFVYAAAVALIVVPLAIAAIFNPAFLRRQINILRRRTPTVKSSANA